MAGRLARSLPAYLNDAVSPAERRAIVRSRLEEREQQSLRFIRRVVFDRPDSPYRSLLHHVGCDFTCFEELVRQEGLEGALTELLRQGVYLTLDEFKGRVRLIRGSLSVEVTQDRFRNPLSATHFLASTSGSRGRYTTVGLDLDCVRERAVNMLLALHAWQADQCRMAIWTVRGLTPVLWYSGDGRPVERWFRHGYAGGWSLGDPFEWGRRVATWTSYMAGTPLPTPEQVEIEQARPVASWLREVLADGQTPHLWCTPSSAVRLCQFAEADGIDIGGTRFTLTGEPITEGRLAVVERVGGIAAPDYGAADTGGSIAYGCRAPASVDDVHVFTDLNAVIAAHNHPDFPDGALLLTALRSTAPFVMINVSLGDRASLEVRSCGCPMEGFGWRQHLRRIRSFEKLTVGGVSFEDSSIVEILERDLPERFGGGPTDYQVVEALGEEDGPRLLLCIAPAVGSIDEDEVADAFVNALGKGSRTRREMASHLRSSGMLEIVRRTPRSGTGKIHHLVAIPDQDRPRLHPR